MPSPTCTITELQKLIKDSGYPFELSVAEMLMSQGFEVRLSPHFFNPIRQQDSEIDILAIRKIEAESKHLGHVCCNLELAIECKDNSLPYVLFGFPAPQPPPDGIVDGDCFYMKIRTTDDKFANYFAVPSFGDDPRDSAAVNIKQSLHQFKGDFRFHQAVAVEQQNNKRLKLHVTDRLRTAINGLAGYVEHTQETWLKAKKTITDMSYDPTVWVSFLLLVHSGNHYRYTEKSSLEAANHTTLFTSFNSSSSTIPLAVDFVSQSELLTALKTIEGSFNVVANQILRYLKPSPRPLKEKIRQQ